MTQVGTSAQRVVVTDDEGRFSVPGLRPATYSVRVELQGFTPAEIKELTLRNGETVRPTLTLGLGNVTEQITVTGESSLLQTQSASVGQVISEKMIEDLPLEWPRRTVAHGVVRWSHAASVQSRHAVRRSRQQS